MSPVITINEICLFVIDVGTVVVIDNGAYAEFESTVPKLEIISETGSEAATKSIESSSCGIESILWLVTSIKRRVIGPLSCMIATWLPDSNARLVKWKEVETKRRRWSRTRNCCWRDSPFLVIIGNGKSMDFFGGKFHYFCLKMCIFCMKHCFQVEYFHVTKNMVTFNSFGGFNFFKQRVFTILNKYKLLF